MEALRGVDLAIPRGSIFVLLGPNGAGKTTLMRCITGLVRPTGGSISVFGALAAGSLAAGSADAESGLSGSASKTSGTQESDGASRQRLARMGVLIENPGAYGRLDVREYLAFFGSFYGIPDIDGRIRSLCGLLGLEMGPKPVAKLSQGNRQKLQLARSLLHRPELLLWDEPTDHLDPASQQDVLTYLRSYLEESGATALLATHRLEQVEAVASHFGFLSQGILAAAGSREEILDAVQAPIAGQAIMWRARLGFARSIRPEELTWLSAPAGPQGFAARIEAVDGENRMLDVSAPDLRGRMPELIKALVERGLPLASAEPRRTTLAETYQRFVGKGT